MITLRCILGSEVVGTDLGLCPVVSFGITCVEPSTSAATV
jgi:hypothetical protein